MYVYWNFLNIEDSRNKGADKYSIFTLKQDKLWQTYFRRSELHTYLINLQHLLSTESQFKPTTSLKCFLFKFFQKILLTYF